MAALVLSGVLLVGLFGWLIALKVREARARGPVAPSRSPQLVDRPHDPSLCDFCDEKRSTTCPACTRPLCALHAPWGAGMFCALCNDEWEMGARRRGFLIGPLVVVAMIVITGIIVVISELASVVPGLAVLFVPFLAAAPIYLAIERQLRRGFRRKGQLPQGRIRR